MRMLIWSIAILIWIIPGALKFSRHPVVYLAWTILWGLYYAAMLGLDVHYDLEYGAEYFIYLTNWSYMLQAAFVFSDLIVTIYVNTRRKDIVNGETSDVTWYMKVTWVLYNTSNTASILVTVLYYALLTPTFGHSSINKHLMNSIFTLLLMTFCAKPTRLLHVYQPMIYSILYLVFSIAYQAAGGCAVYPVLDWDDVGKALLISVLTALIGVPVAHLFTFALYTLRVFIASKCMKVDESEVHLDNPSKELDLTRNHEGAAMP